VCTVRASVVRLPVERRTLEGRTVIATCDVVGEPEPSVEWRRQSRPRPYVLGAQPVSSTTTSCYCNDNDRARRALTLFMRRTPLTMKRGDDGL